ncbi:MBL fold metallo-hydrolase [Oculatella sp. LEGE 06141]|uniref:MBL fold metallo-hydrolase n=1 Tax=Oculatella sp. LEGE 06141 TaxID=1828648 RepID=UPI00187FEAE5|nr:MBL fold metallo-hydrolase [Oculatella sp. LEGE 06141]MBE9179591.1 MBL fold metallo-hydrolase [Oculatella sp. LEGE 06141]
MNLTKELVLPADGDRPNFEQGSLFFVGNATVILRYAGFTILTDPNFLHQGEHVHLGYGIRSARKTNPAIELEDLPPLDLVVLSHMHEDHFDRVVEQKLNHDLPIVTTPHATAKLQQKGFRSTYPLHTWETQHVVKGEAHLRISATPGIHGPGLLQAALPPVMGSMLEFQTSEGQTQFRIYISGDTLIHDEFKQIPQRYPDIDLALIHLGGTRVLGVLLTMDGKQGVRAIEIIAPRTAIPIHYNDYTVMKSPLEDFVKAIAEAGLTDRVRYLNHGDTYQFEPARPYIT